MLDPARYETIKIDKLDDGIVLATLNRPERLNAVNPTMHEELARISREADADSDVTVLVLTGAGRAFCAGADATPLAERKRVPNGEEARQIVDHLLECSKPVISAVNGYAMGLGATVALLCDVVFAARSAVIADTHVKFGLGAGDGGQVIWPLLLGVNRAKYFLMTGERLSADEAERLGLVNFVVDDDKVVDAALELAGRLAVGPRLAISASKRAVNNYMRMVSNLVFPFGQVLELETMRSADHREALQAFKEKREPRFEGQ